MNGQAGLGALLWFIGFGVAGGVLCAALLLAFDRYLRGR
jgi:hypothetical protein